MNKFKINIWCVFYAFTLIDSAFCNDVTDIIFGSLTDGMPAAFGDFNSDELTDIFVLRDNGRTVEIFLANEEEPLIRAASPTALRCTFSNHVTSVVPGDFDGDAFMDVLVTTISKHPHSEGQVLTSIHVLWGGADHLNCSDQSILQMIGQPLALDYNQDMIIDLFGVDPSGERTFWLFNKVRGEVERISMDNSRRTEIKQPHAHAFLGKLFFIKRKNCNDYI